jgi:hypothetical protein
MSLCFLELDDDTSAAIATKNGLAPWLQRNITSSEPKHRRPMIFPDQRFPPIHAWEHIVLETTTEEPQP